MDALTAYLARSNETVSQLALRIGRSPSTLSRALSGQRDPSIGLARDVERGTEGAVSALDFLKLCMQPRKTSGAVEPEPAE